MSQSLYAMPNFVVWFKRLKPSQQVVLVGPSMAAIVGGIFALIVALINVFGPEIKTQNTNHEQVSISQEVIKQPGYIQRPEVNRINSDVSAYFEQVDNKSDINEKQRLLSIIFEQLRESNDIDPNDGETYFLYAEAYLRNSDYSNAIKYYDASLLRKYFYKGNVYLGYGYAYEALGDQYISNNDLIRADVYYKHAVDYLTLAINDSELLHVSIDTINNILSRIEFKKGNYKYAEEYFTVFSSINKDDSNNNNITAMIELATNYADIKLWKNAVRCYYWLFRQNISGQRKLRIIRDFQYYSDFWEFSNDFNQDIAINSVRAVINSEHVNFRQEPIIDNNTIREFILYEEVKILQRSEFKQSIGNVKTYWYKICTQDDIEGWVYGKYLCFYPDFSL
jgi:tetratricopeptide (TPR) repeat protein